MNKFEQTATDALKRRYYEIRKSPEYRTRWMAATTPGTLSVVREAEAIYEELKVRAGNV